MKRTLIELIQELEEVEETLAEVKIISRTVSSSNLKSVLEEVEEKLKNEKKSHQESIANYLRIVFRQDSQALHGL